MHKLIMKYDVALITLEQFAVVEINFNNLCAEETLRRAIRNNNNFT